MDKNARHLIDGQSAEPEDALIILSPYDTTDIIGVRRVLARYGQTRTIIIVNSRMETLPRELDLAVLVYGFMPLVARYKGSNGDGDDDGKAGLKVVVMKRFPTDWRLFVDVYGEGFVEVTDGDRKETQNSKQFPSAEWIAQRVQAHVQGLS